MMRIITGKARGVRLATLSGENTRPTAERVKEAVFSMLQFDIRDKQVLITTTDAEGIEEASDTSYFEISSSFIL